MGFLKDMEFELSGIILTTLIISVMFAFVARWNGNAMWVGALWGGLAGLTLCMITVGLAHAVAIPYTSEKVSSNYLSGLVAAFIPCAIVAAAMAFWPKVGPRVRAR